ncbi:MAG: hypothetical protein OXC05_07515 [Halieaceae bacterium]|nr:hypothetical protein [Halieaceae bacterium]
MEGSYKAQVQASIHKKAPKNTVNERAVNTSWRCESAPLSIPTKKKLAPSNGVGVPYSFFCRK